MDASADTTPLIERALAGLRSGQVEIEFVAFSHWSETHVVCPHVHGDVFQLDLFPKGHGTYGVDGEVHAIDPQTFFFVPPGHRHEIVTSVDRPLSNLTVKFRHPRIGQDFLPVAFRPPKAQGDAAEALFRQVVSESVLEIEARDMVAALRLAELLALLAQSRQGGGGPKEANPVISTAMRFMADHFAEPIALEDIAGSAGVAREYLCRLFKKETGTTPFALLRQWRVEFAWTQLVRTDKTISEIAVQSGFGSARDMNRVFRHQFGMGPRDRRKVFRREA